MHNQDCMTWHSSMCRAFCKELSWGKGPQTGCLLCLPYRENSGCREWLSQKCRRASVIQLSTCRKAVMRRANKAWSRSYHSNLPADSVSTCQWGKAPDQLVHTGIWKYVLSFSLFTGKGLPEEIEHSIYLYWGDFRLQGSWAGRDLGSWGRIFRLCWNPDFLPPDFLHCWVSLWRANYLTSGPMPVLSRSLSALAPACQYVCSSFPAKLLCLTSHRSGMLAARLIVSTVTFHVFWQNVWCGSVRAESAKNISRGKSFSAATES